MRPFVLGLLLPLLLSGCARLQTFRVVDQSGQPVGGVPVERLQGSLQLDPVPFFLLDSMSPVEKRTSDGSGSVAFHESGKQFMVNPQSKNQAYVTATWSGAKVCYPAESREISVNRTGGVVEIPLPNGPSGQGSAKQPRMNIRGGEGSGGEGPDEFSVLSSQSHRPPTTDHRPLTTDNSPLTTDN
jgi:hypothetical protein